MIPPNMSAARGRSSSRAASAKDDGLRLQGCNAFEWIRCGAIVAGCAGLSGPALIACVAAAAPGCVKCVT
jgi:hypothetical protein